MQGFLPMPGRLSYSGSVLFQGVFRGMARNSPVLLFVEELA